MGMARAPAWRDTVTEGWDGNMNPRDEQGWLIEVRQVGGGPGVDFPVRGEETI